MGSSLNGLAVRRRLGRGDWAAPVSFGPDGWGFQHLSGNGAVLVTVADCEGEDWVHASISWADHMPTYADLKHVPAAVFDGGWAYQVFAPPSDHVNIHPRALHLYGRVDGKPVLPDFTYGRGSI